LTISPAYKRAANPNRPAPIIPGIAVAIGAAPSEAADEAELALLLAEEPALAAELCAELKAEAAEELALARAELALAAPEEPAVAATELMLDSMEPIWEEMEDSAELILLVADPTTEEACERAEEMILETMFPSGVEEV
jgi:hypothetical protein